ncbi:MAG: uroporphyrinogen decarboxylase family protein [Anaerolineales bacterium]|jgi:hypothetical protein
MNSRQRFLETMCGGKPDHPPLFMEGIRAEVLRAWRTQGLPAHRRLESLFHYDAFEELSPEIYPIPEISDWSDKQMVLKQLRQRLDPDDPRRLPAGWSGKLRGWKNRQHPLFLRIHQGILQSLGVQEWRRFEEALLLLVDDPEFVRTVLGIQASFAAALAANLLREVDIDAVIFSEPIAGMSGALISPHMYRQFALRSYTTIFDVLERFEVPVVIWRSYANPSNLIPEIVRSRFTAVWACETNPEVIDYQRLREKFGPEIGLIGGIDTDVLRLGPGEIRRAVEKVLPLIEQGRFIPLADGRVREGIPYENYATYRRVLEQLIIQSPGNSR